MKITFLGAAKTVTGSNFLVEAAGKKFLVDCGMWQGRAEDEMKNESKFEFNPEDIDFMLLTHAHIDHSGRIPKLYNEGFKNKIYAHKATCDLCGLMLPDSGHIQEMEAEWKNRKRLRKGEKEVPPMYTAEDALNCIECFEPVNYDEIVKIDKNITVRYNDAGHMLGSSIIEIWIDENGEKNKIVFTGDIGNNDIPLLASPTMIDSADYLVMESTYGNRLHLRNDQKIELFVETVSSTLDKGGTVVVPSFAVGRTQEIVYELNKLKERRRDPEFARKYETIMRAPVYVDSPLAISATEVFRQNMNLFEDEIQEEMKNGDNPLEFPGLAFTKTAEESKALNIDKRPSIIISASGMCEVGRIKHHLKHNLWNPNSTILFVGYQAPGTLGASIVNGAKKVKIFGEEIAVNAKIEYIEGFSGHADQEWLMNFIYSFKEKPKKIFLVHGEGESQVVLKNKIKEETNIDSYIPNFNQSFLVDKNNVEVLNEGMEIVIEKTEQEQDNTFEIKKGISRKLEKLMSEIKTIKNYAEEDIKSDVLNKDKAIKLNNQIKDLEKQVLSILRGE